MPALAILGRALRNRRSDPALGVAGRAELAVDRTLAVASPAFADGGEIPALHGGRGGNVSPALSWSGVPEGTGQLLLILEDVDVPKRMPAVHTIALIDPSSTGLGEGELRDSATVRLVPAMLGIKRYVGPRPLPGHGPHRYGFHLWSLDRAVPAGTRLKSLAQLLPLIAGHVTAHGVVVGIQEG